MNVSVDMRYKPGSLIPETYVVKAIEKVSPATFKDVLDEPFKEWPCIATHSLEMVHDVKTGESYALVIFCDNSNDAILVHGAGYNYALMAAYAPGFMVALEQHVRDEVMLAVKDHATKALESEENSGEIQMMLTWDELGELLGFEFTVENGMCGIAMDEVFNLPIVKSHSYEDDGIRINTDSAILHQHIATPQTGDIHL